MSAFSTTQVIEHHPLHNNVRAPGIRIAAAKHCQMRGVRESVNVNPLVELAWAAVCKLDKASVENTTTIQNMVEDSIDNYLRGTGQVIPPRVKVQPTAEPMDYVAPKEDAPVVKGDK